MEIKNEINKYVKKYFSQNSTDNQIKDINKRDNHPLSFKGNENNFLIISKDNDWNFNHKIAFPVNFIFEYKENKLNLIGEPIGKINFYDEVKIDNKKYLLLISQAPTSFTMLRVQLLNEKEFYSKYLGGPDWSYFKINDNILTLTKKTEEETKHIEYNMNLIDLNWFSE